MMKKFFPVVGFACLTSLSASAQTIETRIIDGTNTTAAAYPSYVTVTAAGSMCGGTLIDSQWVLTAGHCLTNSYNAPVSTGSINVAINPSGTTNGTVNTDQWVGASVFYLHPQYSFPTNDIALIKLSQSVSATPIALNNDSSDVVGMSATVVGLGSITRQTSGQTVVDQTPAQLQQATIPIVNWSVCNGYYSGGVPENLICAGYANNPSADACTGDSGGPLYIYRNGQKIQAGVVSFGSGCGVGAPGGYTDISKYKSFIRQYVSSATFAGEQTTQTVSDVTGVWYDPSRNGVGFTIVKSTANLSNIYYGYRSSGTPQWLIGTTAHSGDITKGSAITMAMYTPTDNNGANFITAPTTVNSGTSYWGAVSFTFTGCNTATATLTGNDGTMTYNMTKLQTPQAVSCTE